MPEYKITGRPKKYNSAKHLTKKVNEYFDSCDADKEPYTMNGLGLFIGLDRHQLITYKHSKEFYPIIKESIQRIAHDLEVRAITHGNSAGPIFLLKNMGYSDARQHEITGHNGKELKWKIEVVRSQGDATNYPRLERGAGRPQLVADNTVIDPERINQTNQGQGQGQAKETAKLLPGVVNFEEVYRG